MNTVDALEHLDEPQLQRAAALHLARQILSPVPARGGIVGGLQSQAIRDGWHDNYRLIQLAEYILTGPEQDEKEEPFAFEREALKNAFDKVMSDIGFHGIGLEKAGDTFADELLKKIAKKLGKDQS